ncbi:hypothetical protein CO662_02415 [Rhizobium anhuiense]|uniref:Transcriptional regulator n=1 Tax=Rhizobium anhuiense TaxID=1184720 RepID=A0ABX4JEK7_9HYPH|nr:hypothetical protein CO662_02415 [Rhizobium anhuiense]PDS60559.1 hypothetical protein CO663_02480 [Rhizobium anhuiense]GGD62445.1 hypothetical protein GCM10008012_03630 [Rhizobium anhuiense]
MTCPFCAISLKANVALAAKVATAVSACLPCVTRSRKSMSRKSVQRFCENDMLELKGLDQSATNESDRGAL